VPFNYPEFTARRVFTAEWIDGEKLSQSKADDVGQLINVGVIAYLTQLLDTGNLHAGERTYSVLVCYGLCC
jgi:aarF domain-containing kinase